MSLFLILVANNGDSYSALIVLVSSHGGIRTDSDGFYEVIQAYDRNYRKSILWECFAEKPDWEGKPLLFFFQACRGPDATQGARMSIDGAPEQSKVLAARQTLTEIKPPNLFIMNATQPGAVAFKCDIQKNSAFIDAIHEIFTRYASKLDLYSLAVKVCDKIARDCENCSVEFGFKDKYECSQQMPCFESTLTTKLHLASSEFSQDETLECFYESTKNPVVLFLSYTSKDNDEETIRVEEETRLLMNYFLFHGYKCEEEWDIDYPRYRHLSKFLPLREMHFSTLYSNFSIVNTTFNKDDKSPFIVIFNGFGEHDTIMMGEDQHPLHELWQPLFPQPTSTETFVEKPKFFIFLVRFVLLSR